MPISCKAPQAPSPETLADFAARVIRKRRKRLLAGALMLSTLSTAERHRVRVDAKRLRYGLDALASLFRHRAAGTTSPRRSRGCRRRWAISQRRDTPALEPAACSSNAPAPFADFARGWFGARAQAETALLEPLVAELTRRRSHWLVKA